MNSKISKQEERFFDFKWKRDKKGYRIERLYIFDEKEPVLSPISGNTEDYSPIKEVNLHRKFAFGVLDQASANKFVDEYGFLERESYLEEADYERVDKLIYWSGVFREIIGELDRLKIVPNRSRKTLETLYNKSLRSGSRMGTRLVSPEGYPNVLMHQIVPSSLLSWMILILTQEITSTHIEWRVCKNPKCRQNFWIDALDGRQQRRENCKRRICRVVVTEMGNEDSKSRQLKQRKRNK